MKTINDNGDGDRPNTPLLPRTASSPLPPVEHAALFIEDAMEGVRRLHPRPGLGPRNAFVFLLEVVPFVQLCAVGGVLLTFFERPLWCKKPATRLIVRDPCENAMYPSYPMSYLSLEWNAVMELLLFLPILGHNLLTWYYQGNSYWVLPHGGEEAGARWRQLSRMLCVGLYIGDLLYGYLTPTYFFRLAPYLRICFVVLYSSATRDRLRMVMRTLPDVLSIMLLIGCYIVFFAWLGVLCFPAGTAENLSYFSNLKAGVWSLYVLLTTANFPDVMMPAYVQDRLSLLFFVAFVTLGVFFLMNLLTAAVFNTYKRQVKENRTRLQENAQKSLEQAFRLLSRPGATEEDARAIDKLTMRALFEELNHYKDIAYVTREAADWHFHRLDTDGSSSLTWEEFSALAAELRSIRRHKPRPPLLERRFPELRSSPAWLRLRSVVHDYRFDMAIDLALVLNVAVTVAETWGAITGEEARQGLEVAGEGGRWQTAELCLTVFYVVETTLKITVDGVDGYRRSLQNCFDFVITVATSFVAIIVYLPNEFDDHRWIHYISMVRLLRVMRLLLHVPSFHDIVQTFIQMLPDAIAVLKILFCFMYTFAVVGVQLFGGVINTDPTSPYYKAVAESDFGKMNYYANNFNDMASGMATLFELLVVNNWFVLAGGYAVAVGDVALAYFVLFHQLCVCVCLNIVVAFILDTFIEVYEGVEDRRDLPYVET